MAAKTFELDYPSFIPPQIAIAKWKKKYLLEVFDESPSVRVWFSVHGYTW